MVIIPTEKRFDWKHTPLVLFALVILNSLIYFGYQFGDGYKQMESVVDYKSYGFLEKEWPLFREYLEKNHETQRLEKNQKLYDEILSIKEKDQHVEYEEGISLEYELIQNIITDIEFYEYLEENAYTVFYLNYIEKWALPRREINEKIKSVSAIALGLIPNDISIVTLVSHQFLHGSVMHLLGNMFFLIICGFAVEAAIGHLRFLLFYIGSGTTAGLLFAIMDLSSTVPLVGASGAISGVMAMYLGVFRFKKIEFFYWFFIFVGYFRAPALLILPFYIGKELIDYFSDTSSNVAFMAHAGGFIAGSVMMAITYFINPQILNTEYIEENQDTPKVQEELAGVYENISRSRFRMALTQLEKIIKNYGEKFEWNLLRYHLLKIQQNEGYKKAMVKLLCMNRLEPYELNKIETIWKKNILDMEFFKDEDLYQFGMNMINVTNLETAEEVFLTLNDRTDKHPNLGMYARKLSVIFARTNNNDKNRLYEKIAISLL